MDDDDYFAPLRDGSVTIPPHSAFEGTFHIDSQMIHLSDIDPEDDALDDDLWDEQEDDDEEDFEDDDDDPCVHGVRPDEHCPICDGQEDDDEDDLDDKAEDDEADDRAVDTEDL